MFASTDHVLYDGSASVEFAVMPPSDIINNGELQPYDPRLYQVWRNVVAWSFQGAASSLFLCRRFRLTIFVVLAAAASKGAVP